MYRFKNRSDVRIFWQSSCENRFFNSYRAPSPAGHVCLYVCMYSVFQKTWRQNSSLPLPARVISAKLLGNNAGEMTRGNVLYNYYTAYSTVDHTRRQCCVGREIQCIKVWHYVTPANTSRHTASYVLLFLIHVLMFSIALSTNTHNSRSIEF